MVRILGDSISRLMQRQAMTADSRIPGFALGFYEQSSHGLRIIGHGGDIRWFHTNLALVPAEALGIFVTFNTDASGRLTEPFLDRFLDHDYPKPVPPVAAPAGAAAMAERVAGVYLTNRHSYTTYQKGFGLVMGSRRVRAESGGRIAIVSDGETTRYLPLDSLLYREELSGRLAAFKSDGSGRIIRLFLSSDPTSADERLAWYQAPRFHLAVLGLALGLSVLAIGGAAGRWYRKRTGAPAEAPLAGRVWTIGLSLANIGFAVAVVILAADLQQLLFKPGPGLKVALAFPVVGVLLALGGVAAAVRQWRAGSGTPMARVGYAVTVVAGIAFAWSLSMWNLLGWRT